MISSFEETQSSFFRSNILVRNLTHYSHLTLTATYNNSRCLQSLGSHINRHHKTTLVQPTFFSQQDSFSGETTVLPCNMA